MLFPLLFGFKIVDVVNSCYYRMRAHTTKTGVAVRIVLEVVRYCTTEAHHRDFNLSAFVFVVESCNAFFKAVEKHFGSKVLAETKLGVFEELQAVCKSLRLFVVNATFRAFAVKSYFFHIVVLLVS